jgi:hypothetical protein
MTGIWTPPGVSHRLREETARREGTADAGLIDQRWKWVEDFNRDLEGVWSGMRLKWCPDPAPVEAVAMGAKPGRWGILIPGRGGGPASVKPIMGPDGEFVDPSLNASAIFEQLAAADWWDPRVRRDRERAQEEAKRASAKRKQEESDERTDWILERYWAATHPSVSMNRDSKWSNTNAGRRAVNKKGKG